MNPKTYWPDNKIYWIKSLAWVFGGTLAVSYGLPLLLPHITRYDDWGDLSPLFLLKTSFCLFSGILLFVFYTDRVILSDEFIKGPYCWGRELTANKIPLHLAEIIFDTAKIKALLLGQKFDVVIKNKSSPKINHKKYIMIEYKLFSSQTADEIKNRLTQLSQS